VTKGTSWRPFFIVIPALFIVIAGLFIVIASRRRGNPGKSKTQKSKGKMTEQSLEM